MPYPRALTTFYAHGGRVAEARAVFGGEDWVDLSTGIAPWTWPVEPGLAGLDRLPEPAGIRGLEAAAAQAFAVTDPELVVAVPGTDLAMRLLASLISATSPAVLQPGYAGHHAAWPTSEPVSDATGQRLEGRDLLVLASPANPDGQVADPATLLSLTNRMRLIVDEAYADPHPGVCPHASDRLVVLRSFGKFYGLPGLRLGFVVAGPGIVARLRGALGDWPVSSPAVAIGSMAYRDRAWQAEQHGRITAAGSLLDSLLVAAGLSIVGSAPLFRLISTGRAADLFETLARHAILTRPFSDLPDRLRIGLPADAKTRSRLVTALEEFGR